MQLRDTTAIRDVATGSAIAAAMAATFALASPGLALIVTFVPGVVAAWLVFLHLCRTSRPLPEPGTLLPPFGLALAVQFLHFAEEYATGFPARFGPIYGGPPIPGDIFVAFNMAAYAVFLLAAIGLVFRRLCFLLVPVLFFAIYGVIGNAVSHLVWSLLKGGYFPGLASSLAYWFLGPLLLRRIGLNRKEAWLVVLVFGLCLVATVVSPLNVALLRQG